MQKGLIRVAALAICPLFFAAACVSPFPPALSDRPNIILIIGDDHHYSDFGFMGSSIARTPHIDRLAAEGVVFTQGYSTASRCRPALHSLLTGLYPHQWNRRIDLLQRRGVRERFGGIQDFQTLPRLLGSNGYATLQAGKYFEGTYQMGGFTHGTAEENNAGRYISDEVYNLVRETMEPVFGFIQEHRETPFFVWFAPMLPHLPFNAPARFTQAYEGAPIDEIDVGYYANVTWFDEGVAR